MTIENAIGICQNTTRHSWRDLDHIIDLMNQGQFGSLDETRELWNNLSEKIQSLAIEDCAPYISVLSKTEIIRDRRLCPEDFYYDGITHEYSYLWKKLNDGKQPDWLGNDTRPVHIYEAFDVATVYNQEQLYHPDYIFLISEKRSFQNYLQSLTNASVGYHLFVMIEIEKDNRVGLLFSKSGKWNPYQKHPRYYRMGSFICRMIYAEGKDIHEIDGAPGSPKFIYLLKQEEEEEAGSIAICNSVKDVNDEEYYCFDYGHKTLDFSRKFAGDPLLRQAINRTKSPFLLRKQRYATSPAIIIDFLTMKAISFVKKSTDEDDCIFLLNDNHIAVTLSNDYLSDESNYTRYKRATDKLNDKLGRKFNSLEDKASSVPGLQFHCSRNERELFISEIVPSILYGKQRNRMGNGVSKGIILNPCGFDISKYLEKLENKGFIKAIKGGADNSIILRYEKTDSCTTSDIVLFAFIMNCKISSAYEALSNEKVKTLSESPRTKKEWDIIYDMTGWGSYPDTHKSDDKKYQTKDFKWKKIRREQEYSYNRDEFPYTVIRKDQKYTEKYQFRTKYFSQLFSLSERTLSSLKQTAAFPVRAKSKHRDILDCILEVDTPMRVKEDLLFVNWNKHLVESGDYTQQEVSDLFCPDGLHLTGDPMKTDNNVWTVNPDNQEERLWNQSKFRCVFLSKDYNSGDEGEGMNLREETGRDNKASGITLNQFHKSYFMMYYGFMNCDCDGTYPPIEEALDQKRVSSYFYHHPVVRINVKKISGKSRCEDSQLKKAIERDSKLISQQIDLYNPNIIICLNGEEKSPIMHFLMEKYPDAMKIQYPDEEFQFIYYSKRSKVIIIHEYHPSCLEGGEERKYIGVRQLARFLKENPGAID